MTLYNTYKHSFRLFIQSESEWELIKNKDINVKQLFANLILPLILLMSLCNFLGYRFFDNNPSQHFQMHLFSAISTFVFSIVSIFLSAFLVKQFAMYKDQKMRFRRAFVLIGFSYFPGLILNSIAFLFPIINYLTIFSLYSFFILFKGITPMLNIPVDKKSGYFTFILIGLLSIYAVVGAFFIGTASLLGF